MLKIKDDKWQWLCKNYQKFGFDKFTNISYKGEKYYCFIAPKGTYKVNDALVYNKDCVMINASSCGCQNNHEIITTFSSMENCLVIDVANRKQFEILYDLIKADMVEKIEE